MNPPQVYMCSPSWTLLPPPLTNWDSVLKRKDITLLTEVHIINTMVLPVVIYRYESWKIKKAEHRRNSYFWIVVLEKTLESLLESKEITPVHPEYSLEGLMLELKLQYFGHLMRRAGSFENTLMLRKIEARRRRGQQKMRWLDGITDSMEMNLGKRHEMMRGREVLRAAVHGIAESQTQLGDWTTATNVSSSSHTWIWKLDHKEG